MIASIYIFHLYFLLFIAVCAFIWNDDVKRISGGLKIKSVRDVIILLVVLGFPGPIEALFIWATITELKRKFEK